MKCLEIILGMAMLVVLFSGTVLAHDPGLSSTEVRILPDRIVAEVSFARVDLDQKLGERLLEIKADEQILRLTNVSVQTPDTTSIHFTLEFPSSPAAELRLSAVALEHLPRGHKQFLSVRDSNGKLLAERLLSAESKDLTITLQTNSGSSSERFFRFLVLGIEHILPVTITSHSFSPCFSQVAHSQATRESSPHSRSHTP